MLLDVTPFLALLIPTTMIAIAAGIFWLKRQKRAIRTSKFEQLAQQMDLAYAARDTNGFGKLLQGFELFKRESRSWGTKGRISNVLSGHVGDTQVHLFDYTYLVSTGKSVHEISQTVFFANNSNWSLPNFSLKPENWWRKLMLKLGLDQDINFPENPDFSERFWLKGDIASMIREQFSPEMQQFVTDHPPATLEGNNFYLIAYKPRKTLDGEEAKRFFEQACQLSALLDKNGGKEFLDLAKIKAPVTSGKEI